MNSRRLLAVLLVLPAVGAVVAAAARLATSRSDRPAAAPAARETVRFLRNPASISPFSVRDLDGHPISSSDWAGKVVLVNFWATWCPPCRAEIPDLVALQEKYRDQLQIIGISEDEGSPELVKQFAAGHKINYPVAMATPELERRACPRCRRRS